MAYTVGKEASKMRGTYWFQKPLLTIANVASANEMQNESLPMINAIKEALKIYNGESGLWPEHIFVFRGGAPEGEFKKVKLN